MFFWFFLVPCLQAATWRFPRASFFSTLLPCACLYTYIYVLAARIRNQREERQGRTQGSGIQGMGTSSPAAKVLSQCIRPHSLSLAPSISLIDSPHGMAWHGIASPSHGWMDGWMVRCVPGLAWPGYFVPCLKTRLLQGPVPVPQIMENKGRVVSQSVRMLLLSSINQTRADLPKMPLSQPHSSDLRLSC